MLFNDFTYICDCEQMLLKKTENSLIQEESASPQFSVDINFYSQTLGNNDLLETKLQATKSYLVVFK